MHLDKIVGHERISVNDQLETNSSIEDYIKPYRDRVNRDLDSVIAYSKDTYSKNDGELNTAIGNFMADAVLELSQPIFNQRTGKNIDMALLNYGGIRSIISKGDVTSRTGYQVMPFENSVLVTALTGKQLLDMVDYLANAKKAHPIANMQIVLNEDYTVKTARVNNQAIIEDKTYYVATLDYLYNGGSNMTFLKSKDSVYDLNYKLRNLYIDYFKRIDTLQPRADERFIRLK